MLNKVCFLIFLLGSILADEERVAHFEGSHSGIAAGLVNVISGSIVYSETDLVIPGVDPLHISRSPLYAPNYFPRNKVKESWNFPFMERLERNLYDPYGGALRENLVIHQGSQEILCFSDGATDRPEMRFFKSSDHPLGYTNHRGEERPTGRTALKNYAINRGSPHWMTLYSGSGEVRDYHGDKRQTERKDIILLLKAITKPNGFRSLIQYDRNNEKQGRTSVSPSGKEVAYYCTDDRGDALSVQSFDGRSVQYTFQKIGGKNGSCFRLLKEVERTDGPTVKYDYLTENLNKGQLKKIQYPEDRGVSFAYWDNVNEKNNRSSCKVQAVFQPAGVDSTPVQTHSFNYYTKNEVRGGWTDVVDFEGNKDAYLFGADYRLKEVRYYKGMAEKHFVEKFFWDKEGQLSLSSLSDGHDNPLRAKSYRYTDGRGNATEERIFGNLTGNGKTLPRQDEKGRFEGSGYESYGSEFEYSTDGKNLLVKERHENGLTIRYSYLNGTDLVAEKNTFAHDIWVQKESLSYDEDHRLLETIGDDGERKTITRFVPLKIPFGYPEEKKIYGSKGDTGEIFLESYHYTYSLRGDVTSEERRDSAGNTIYKIERTYDNHGNCTFEKNAAGDLIRRTFDQSGNCILEEGPRSGFVKTFSYDWMNRCTQETVTYQGEVTKKDYAYNKRSHLISIVDQFNQTTRFVVDRFGNQVAIELPPVLIEGVKQTPIIKQEFDHFGNALTITDPLGRHTIRAYTSKNKPYFLKYPDGTTEHFRYTLDGHLSQSIDQDGIETKYLWDPLGRLQVKETPFGAEYFNYKGLSLSCSVDLAGVETHYSYDAFGRLCETSCDNRRETISYDIYGYPCRKSYHEGEKLLKTEVTCYDALKRVIRSYVEDPSGIIFCVKCFEYDGAGNCLVEWDDEAKTVKTYDSENRVVRVVDPQGSIYRINYVKGDVLEKTLTDPLGHKTVTLYDTQGKEVKISHFDSFGIELSSKSLFYDLAGNLTKEETKAEGVVQTILYTLDSKGRVIVQREPLQKVTKTSYTPAGRIAILTKPDGVELIHGYDRGRLVTLKSSDGRLAYTYSYSLRGELLEIKDELTGFSSCQSFSLHGDLVEEALPTGQTITYQHDGLGRIVSYSLPDGGEVVTEYNAVTKTSITRLNRDKKPLYRNVYTSFNRRGDVQEQRLIGNAGNVHFAFDEMYQLKEATHSRWKVDEILYDEVGNLLSLNLNGKKHQFSYDDLYQLIGENGHCYTFDPFYNRRSKDGILYCVNELNQLSSTDASHFTYDPNGNLTQIKNEREVLQFGYDPLNRLVFIKKGAIEVHFKYDPFNRRVSENEKPFYFFGHQEIGDEKSLRILGLGIGEEIGAAIALELEGKVYAPLHDHNGSISALLDLDGNLVEEWSYTAFGEQIGDTSSPWTFSSKRKNPVTGWLSFGRRDYDSETGRWTTPDPLGFAAGPNLYAYVSNRPLTHRDPLGLFEIPSFNEPYITDWVPQNHDGSFPQVQFFHAFEDALKQQGYENVQRSNTYSVGHLEVPGKGVGIQNGIFNGKIGALETGEYFSKLGKGMKIDVFHNATHGCQDFVECGMGKSHIATTPVKFLHQGWNDFFVQNPNGNYLMFCHSQGAIHVMNALLTFDKDLAKRIKVVAIAPAAYIYERSCGSVVHYRTSSWLRDGIAHFSDRAGAKREAATIRELESHKDAPWFDHTVLSPTYKDSISYEIKKFIKGEY